MNVELEATAAEDAEAARRDLVGLTRTWGHEAEVSAAAPRVQMDRPGERGLDPVAVAALFVSIPSAALAVHDLVDRMRNRKRAQELIDRAGELEAQQVTVRVVLPDRTVELTGLSPDQLLELAGGLGDEEPVDRPST